jgi:hypothetical protein
MGLKIIAVICMDGKGDTGCMGLAILFRIFFMDLSWISPLDEAF